MASLQFILKNRGQPTAAIKQRIIILKVRTRFRKPEKGNGKDKPGFQKPGFVFGIVSPIGEQTSSVLHCPYKPPRSITSGIVQHMTGMIRTGINPGCEKK